MKKFLVALVVLVVLSYGLFEARKLLEGPEIIIDYPADGSATSTTAVTVAGTAQNISFLTINDASSYTDEAGKFVYRYSPSTGYNVVTVAAVDRFGRRASVSITFNVVTYCIENYGV